MRISSSVCAWRVCVLALGALFYVVSLVGADRAPILAVSNFPNRLDRGVIEWDSPVFVAYDDGLTIWRKGWIPSLDALVAVRDEHPRQVVQKLRKIVAKHHGKVFRLTAGSDPEVTTIWSDGRAVRIEGDWRQPHVVRTENAEDAAAFASANLEEQKRWERLPKELRVALQELLSFNDTAAESWRPETLMVTLIPGGLGEPVEWPKGWFRGFTDVPEQPGVIQAMFPGEMLQQLTGFFAANGHAQAVRYAGKKMYGRIRLLFPGESAWREGSEKRGQDLGLGVERRE